MDNEISEGLHLGTMLIVAVAIGVILVTMSSIVRRGYIYRNRDVIYGNNVQDTLIWKELYLEADLQYGYANRRHVTDTDTTLRFLNNYVDEYMWVVFVRNETNTVWNCYTNVQFTAEEKSELVTLPNIATCNWQYINTEALSSTSTLTDTIYGINSARAVNGHEVKDYVRVLAYTHRSQIAKGEKPTCWFENDFVPSKTGVSIFIIY